MTVQQNILAHYQPSSTAVGYMLVLAGAHKWRGVVKLFPVMTDVNEKKIDAEKNNGDCLRSPRPAEFIIMSCYGLIASIIHGFIVNSDLNCAINT